MREPTYFGRLSFFVLESAEELSSIATMKITINGSVREDFEKEISVSVLLAALEMTGQPVLVEMNGGALFPREFEGKMVQDGAVLEIIRIAAGG